MMKSSVSSDSKADLPGLVVMEVTPGCKKRI